MGVIEETQLAIDEVVVDPDGRIQMLLDNKTKPPGSLGRLEELARTYCSIRGDARAPLRDKVIFTMAGDHGVAAAGVSAYPQQVTAQMVLNFLAGGAGINVLARHVGARVVVVDCGVAADLGVRPGLVVKKVAMGTGNMLEGPAMSRDQAIRSLEVGIEAFEEELPHGIDICGAGDMGIANTTASSAIVSVLARRDPAEVTGHGTGISDESWRHKVSVIQAALARNRPNPSDPLDVLGKVGGFEIGGIAGLCLAAARHRRLIVIDGFISTAGAMIACALEPKVRGYIIAAHVSVEPGHAIMLEWLGKRPLLDLDMRLGEGTGAALGISLVEAGVRILNEMASFEDAGVSKRA